MVRQGRVRSKPSRNSTGSFHQEKKLRGTNTSQVFYQKQLQTVHDVIYIRGVILADNILWSKRLKHDITTEASMKRQVGDYN